MSCPAGLVLSIMGNTTSGAVRIYQITYLVGFTLGCTLHLIVNKIWPPPGLGIEEEFEGSEGEVVVEGVVVSTGAGDGGSETPPTKQPTISDKQIADEKV